MYPLASIWNVCSIDNASLKALDKLHGGVTWMLNLIINIRNSYPNISPYRTIYNYIYIYHQISPLSVTKKTVSIKSSLLPFPQLPRASMEQLLLVPRFPHPSSNHQPSPPVWAEATRQNTFFVSPKSETYFATKKSRKWAFVSRVWWDLMVFCLFFLVFEWKHWVMESAKQTGLKLEDVFWVFFVQNFQDDLLSWRWSYSFHPLTNWSKLPRWISDSVGQVHGIWQINLKYEVIDIMIIWAAIILVVTITTSMMIIGVYATDSIYM